MALRFNPPPGWPPPPEGFTPVPGWQPDPSWSPAPPGWQFWVADDQDSAASGGQMAGSVGYGQAFALAGPAQATPSARPAPPPSTTNGMAIAGFVLGLLGLGGIGAILGIVFGIVALRRIRETAQGGRGLAIAGIVLGGNWLAFIVLIILFGGLATGGGSSSS